MIEPSNPVLEKMLDRLFASMVNGPSMNCKPQQSRQRVDFPQLSRLKDVEPSQVLLALLAPEGSARIAARVPLPVRGPKSAGNPRVAERSPGTTHESDLDAREEELTPAEELTAEERAARQSWLEQQSLLAKLRSIAEDARTYERDTGVHALNVGFPLLSLPPGAFGGRSGPATRRILAPIAFIPVSLTIKAGPKPMIELDRRGEGVDQVIPNLTLFAWLEQQTGVPILEKLTESENLPPWEEIASLVRLVAGRVDVPVPQLFATPAAPERIDLASAPTSEDDSKGKSIVSASVLGLFPAANQGLLRDTREMIAGGAPDGPIESFVRRGVSFDAPPPAPADSAASLPPTTVARSFEQERLVTPADPCQTRAVRLARQCRGLVIHGPPGTGKSQTIANIIGDHLARGERVLFVCDKRTALDVVADRLNSLGLADLCATVHDPQRDQRAFYRSVQEQLDNLSDTPVKSAAAAKLKKIDAELQLLHGELSQYHRQLMGEHGGPGSFHHLVGQWFSETGDVGATIDERSLQNIPAAEFEKYKERLKEALERGQAVGYNGNPWKAAAGLNLASFLSQPVRVYQAASARCAQSAAEADASADPCMPPFSSGADLTAQAERFAQTSRALDELSALPTESAAHWSKQPASAVQATRTALSSAAEWIAEVKRRPLDAALRQACQTIPTLEQIKSDRQVLEDYASAFDERLAVYRRIRAAAPGVDPAIILKWMGADAKSAAAAGKRLEGARPLVTAVEAAAPDPSLLARFESTPIDPTRIIEWLAALGAYVDVARTWHGVFHFGRKKAAEPAVRHFGLSLTPESASRVKQFLDEMQSRRDLRAAVEAATAEKFDATVDDANLLLAYEHNLNVLAALAGAAQPATPHQHVRTAANVDGTDSPISGINSLIAGRAEAARPILGRYALATDSSSAVQLIAFFHALSARIGLLELLGKLAPGHALTLDSPDAQLLDTLELHRRLLDLLADAPAGTPLGAVAIKALVNRSAAPAILKALGQAPARAAAMLAAQKVFAEAGLFGQAFLSSVNESLRSGKCVAEVFHSLDARLNTLEGVLRVKEGLSQLPASLSNPCAALLAADCEPAAGFSVVRRNVLAGEIVRQLQACPDLHAVDGHRLRNTFDRFRKLSEEKKTAVRDAIQAHWVSRQKTRLLASTGSRLNSLGADLRRRLTVKGERAMRLRQVIAHGAALEGGDPLFDLRPIWMASPETISQLFPRQPIFEVVVFDEASQCRLEEALPVLTRAKRVVIAGDPKQLPPTRFFESTVTISADPDDQDDVELFEKQQGEIEDLLTAALGLDIEQSYLDVHYRSRNADLIGFSNQHFYSSRLQAIPGHPRNRTRYAPITLYRCTGTYEKRRNLAEAEQVCKIVHDLLRRADPPSIGIACFNLVQADLIREKLQEMAEHDPEFGHRYAEARERRGPSSSEALFVKNLENVQGDERDHLIISTTYGPDAAGKFRRNFGPLGSAGGGRRLNVLVTRARNELHIVTSIPRSAYASLPEAPAGSTPTGAWLLFAYLAYAEQLQQDYETNHRIIDSSASENQPAVETRHTRTPSQFARALAERLAAAQRHGSDVHWGNDGFCVDLAMHHPTRIEDVTIGVLCDMTRYMGSDDPVEWDVFRTAVHESQGWKLHRLWTPHFFRDPAGGMEEITRQIQQCLEEERRMKPRDDA